MTEPKDRLTLTELLAGLTGQQVPRDTTLCVAIRAIVIDSRQVVPGSLFVALRGEHQDGHQYIGHALEKGAVAVIAEEMPHNIDGCVLEPQAWAESIDFSQLHLPLCIRVPDSLSALQQAAAYWRRQFSVRVIGITGSVGKTTSKEVIASVLSKRAPTLKSEGNYNNEIGLPLTLLRLTSTHKYVVLEMGMYDLGEIALLADIAQPQVGVVTSVGPSHMERLGTIERIAQAKSELPRALPAAADGGVAILNADDARVRAMEQVTQARVFTYGLSQDADVWADDITGEGLEGIRFRLHHGRDSIYLRAPMLGRHSVHTALCATAVGLMEGLSWEEIVGGLRDQTVQLRLTAVPGPHGSTILDDTYNASPDSSVAALNLLDELEGRKIAVLGDMYELGRYEEEGHKMVGRRVRDVADVLVTVGPLGRFIGEEAIRSGMDPSAVFQVETKEEAIERIQSLIAPSPLGDKILIKGSRGMQMETIVSALQTGDRS